MAERVSAGIAIIGGIGGAALAADDVLPVGLRIVDDDGGVAARAVQVGFGDLQGEAGGGGGIEGVAAAFEHGHGDGAGEPVGGADDAEGAGDFWAGGEHGGLPVRESDERVARRGGGAKSAGEWLCEKVRIHHGGAEDAEKARRIRR